MAIDRALDRRGIHRRHVDPARGGLQPGHRASSSTRWSSARPRTWTPRCRPRRPRSPSGARRRSSKRTKILFAFRELVNAHVEQLAEIISDEHGKVLSDAAGEVQRGLEVVEFACGIPQLLKGDYSDQASTGVDVFSFREPLGVCAGITPFNFPAMVPMWMHPVAIACGNTFVLKPSERDPSRVQLRRRAVARGRPAGRRVQRGARRQGRPSTRCCDHPDVAAVSFVGSTPIARYIHEQGLRDRQAGAGARRRQEPRDRAARRRPRLRRRRT